MKLLGDNITDAYNTVTAVAALEEFGLTADAISRSFEKMQIAGTRFGCVEVNGRKIITDVAKGQNPIAVSRVCDFVRHEPGKKQLCLFWMIILIVRIHLRILHGFLIQILNFSMIRESLRLLWADRAVWICISDF